MRGASPGLRLGGHEHCQLLVLYLGGWDDLTTLTPVAVNSAKISVRRRPRFISQQTANDLDRRHFLAHLDLTYHMRYGDVTDSPFSLCLSLKPACALELLC
jgi:hypothetical protein